LKNCALFPAAGGIAAAVVVKPQNREPGVTQARGKLTKGQVRIDVLVPYWVTNNDCALSAPLECRLMEASEE